MKRLAPLPVCTWLLVSVFAGPVLPGAVPVLAGEVVGTVVEGSRGKALPGVEVRLFWQGSEQEAGQATSGAQGRFRITDVAAGSYLASASYHGIPYVASDVLVSEESPRAEVRLEVFQTTTEDEDVIVRADHLILQNAPEGLRVTEVIILDNVGERTYLGEVSPASPTGYGMFLPLPEGYFDLSMQPWLAALKFNPTESGFHLALAVRPGSSQVVLSYGVPGGLGGASLDRRLTLDVKAANVAVPLDAGLALRSAELGEGKPVQIDGRGFLVSSGGPFARDTLLRVRASGGAASTGLSRNQIAWGICGLLTVALGLIWVVHRGKQVPGSPP